MVLVVDTNVFLNEEVDESCEELTRKCRKAKSHELRLGLDAAGQILEEYRKHVRPDTSFRNLVDKLINFEGQFTVTINCNVTQCARCSSEFSQPFVIDAQASTGESECQTCLLNSLSCNVPIQPILLGAGADEAEPVIVYAPNSERIHREYPRHISILQESGLGKGLLTPYETLEVLSYKRRKFPSTLGELEKILDENKVTGRRCETDFMEFKCPTKLTNPMRRDIAKAIQSMLNTCTGWVFVGIKDDDGEITGFLPEYVDDGGIVAERGADAIQRKIIDVFRWIEPDPSLLCTPWVIDYDTDKIIAVIHVVKGDRHFRFEEKIRQRKGPSSSTVEELLVTSVPEST